MSLKVMDKLTEETLTPLEANNVSLDVLHKISNEAPLKDFLQQFLFLSIPIKVLKSQAEVLHQLSGEYQIESVLPWRSFDTIKTICNKLDHNDDCTRVAGNEAVQHPDFGSYSTLGEEYMHTSTCTIFRWFKFTLKPPYRITCGKLRLAIWDTSFWTFWLKFGHKGP